MALVRVTMLVHVEDYSTSTDGSAICVMDYVNSNDGWREVTILDWDETLMVAIPQNTSDEPF